MRKLTKTSLRQYSRQMSSFIYFLCRTWRLSKEDRGYFLRPQHLDAITAFQSFPSTRTIITLINEFWCDDTSVVEGCHATQRWILTWCSDKTEYIFGPQKVTPFLAHLQWVIRISFLSKTVAQDSGDNLPFIIQTGVNRWLTESSISCVFSWYRELLRAASRHSKYQNRTGLVAYTVSDGFGYGRDMVKTERLKIFVQRLEDRAEANFNLLLDFFGFEDKDLPLATIVDDCRNTGAGGCITDAYDTAPLERLQYKVLTGGTCLSACFISLSNTCSAYNKPTAASTLAFSLNWMRLYKTLTLNFLESVIMCCYLGCGQPNRASELVNTVLRNQDQSGSQRNIYGISGLLVHVSYITKQTSLMGQIQRIPRFYSEWFSRLLLRYILYFRPIELWIMQIDPLFALDRQTNARKAADFLFTTLGFSITACHLTSMLRRNSRDSMELVGRGFGVRDFRHVLVFLGRKHIARDLPLEVFQHFMDQQAGHTSETADRWYALDAQAIPWSVSSHTLFKNKGLSEFHHGFLGLRGAHTSEYDFSSNLGSH